MTSQKTPNRLSGRTKIVTGASILAVGLAGLFAIGANVGILASTDPTRVGTLAAAGDLVPTDTKVVDVYLDSQGMPLSSDPSAPVGSQRFTVDTAGTVDVTTDGGVVSVRLITPANGWTAAPVTAAASQAGVTFTSGSRTLHFTATLAADGTVTGDVTEPVAPSITDRSKSSEHSDDHKSDDHKSDDHDAKDRTSDDHGHEGRDSDD
ncbi:MAG TPA: hypothetical protein PLS63_03330 [Microthrixaceae bacterium]|jgi:hypothetical protein|nr:hypothetical protein [Microthrixaceae bacterium]